MTKLRLFFVFSILIIPFLNAYGYIDPGSGSYIIQLIIAGLAGGLYATKVYWSKIRLFISSRFKKNKK